ncbi:AMP-binding protein [Cupriavidus sp. AcVe19-1a]|uniref:AMP-binding protein n=1 Tax=Cupriavidus sp. AcVe19-1a TaxID=2821359 RepID=UPI001AE308C1|nr:AMP-binding protein [Cupriavidus sp. AcVe19-1a]MBP0632891.1 AMP-binding protein [Cupriavidus sp. AcVe19-1a]
MHQQILDAHNPHLPAFYQAGKAVSRLELKTASQRAARFLREMGLRRGDTVAVWLPDGAIWLQLLFGAAQLGVLVVPVSTRLRTAEALHIVNTAQARTIVVPTRFLDFDYVEAALTIQKSVAALKHVIDVPVGGEFMWDTFAPHEVGDSTGDGTDPWCTFSTSGTTGKPKLAIHTQAGIATHVLNVARATNMQPGDATLCALPLYGVMGFVLAISTLAAGAACVFLPVFKAQAAAEAIERHEVTHFYGSDAMLDMVLDVPGCELGSWRRGGFAEFAGLGSRIIQKAWANWNVPLTAIYGMSECFALAAMRDIGAGAEERRLAGGRPISPGISFRIADPSTGEPLAEGEQGELQLRGYNAMAGYLNNPSATADAFTADGWLRTGDLARAQSGAFQYLSRLKDTLRLRGYLVDPAEIEEFLVTHPAVAAAQVVGVHQEGEGDVAVAFIRPGQGHATETELLDFCKRGIAGFKIPRRIVALDSFPQVDGPNGVKILKHALRDIAKEHLQAAPTPQDNTRKTS